MLNDLYNALQETQLPLAYGMFREVPEPPYIVYQFSYSSNFDADDRVFLTRDRYTINLYTKKKDPETESVVENALDTANYVWDKTETFIEGQQVYQISYTIFER